MRASRPLARRTLVAAAIVVSGCATQAQPPAFRIEPTRPIEELRREALAATPPAESRPRATDLVELIAVDPAIRLDIRYATTDNFLGARVYEEARAFLQRPAAEALARAHARLRAQGYGILVHDAYRPWYVTKIFWEATPPDKRDFVADPSQGSRHNRGCAVDLTLVDLRTGRVVVMPSAYDEFSERAHADYPGGTAEQRRLRGLLRSAMEAEGFSVLENEWWHFDYRDWREYPIGNVRFDQIGRSAAENRGRGRGYGKATARAAADERR
jgi:D-alanyl-D-alanine dipeptidase